LEIASNDPANALVTVELSGVGIAAQGEPITVEDILAFLDAGVEAGTIQGTGHHPRMSEVRLKLFKALLLKVGSHIDDDRMRAACWRLKRAYLRSDGQSRPFDFVKGDDVPELNAMILQLRADLGCV